MRNNGANEDDRLEEFAKEGASAFIKTCAVGSALDRLKAHFIGRHRESKYSRSIIRGVKNFISLISGRKHCWVVFTVFTVHNSSCFCLTASQQKLLSCISQKIEKTTIPVPRCFCRSDV